MDIPRPELARKRRIKRLIYGGVGLVLVSSITWALSKLKPAAPDVDRNVLYFGTVKRGPMIRDVRGLGTLTPVEIQWVPALTEGRVVKRLVLPGTPVKANTVILILSNLQLEQEAGDAEFQLKAAQAQYDALKVQLQTTLLDQRATAATVESDYKSGIKAHGGTFFDEGTLTRHALPNRNGTLRGLRGKRQGSACGAAGES